MPSPRMTDGMSTRMTDISSPRVTDTITHRSTNTKSPRLTELLEAAGKESMVELPSRSSLRETGTLRLTELLEESRESKAPTTEDGKRDAETRLTDLLEESRAEEKTPRLTELLEEAEKNQPSELSRSSDAMDTEETVLLQGLLETADGSGGSSRVLQHGDVALWAPTRRRFAPCRTSFASRSDPRCRSARRAHDVARCCSET